MKEFGYGQIVTIIDAGEIYPRYDELATELGCEHWVEGSHFDDEQDYVGLQGMVTGKKLVVDEDVLGMGMDPDDMVHSILIMSPIKEHILISGIGLTDTYAKTELPEELFTI